MLVRELIAALATFNSEAVVAICADNGSDTEGGDLSTCNIRTVDEGGPYVGDPATDAGYVVAIWCPYGVNLDGVDIEETIA